MAGPTLKKLTPAPTTSANASPPEGVVPPGGGPLASTIGNTFCPPSRTVPDESVVVTAAPATVADTSATATAPIKATLTAGE